MRKKVIIISLAFMSQVFVAFGQSNSLLEVAFSDSYQSEKVGDYKKASDIIKSVYDANSYEINLRLGWLEYNAGLFTESAAHYHKAMSIFPYSEEAKFAIINTLVAQGKWDEVIKVYQSILEVSPSNFLANYRLGLIQYGKKDYTTAFKLFEKATNLYPFNYDALLMFAWSNYFTGKKREAKILFNKVLLLSPGDYSATEGIGLCN